MKIKKKLLGMITAVLCILSMVLPVCAEGSPSRVTFENIKNTNPDLYVTKQVENADDRYEMPDTRFSFVLKLDGKLASETEYRVYDESGKEVYKYEDGESTEDKSGKLRFTTTRSGNFTLRGGQTARFEYVGQGVQYEVSEQESDGWTQISPAAGTSLKGTVAAEGSSAVFTNLYEPVVPGRDTADLKIVKNISYPEGYELPGETSFGFTLKIAGKAYAGENYTVIDNAGGQEISTGTTDGEGHFMLPQNTTAVFKDVTAEADYEITEDPAEGWRTVGDTVRKGVVQGPMTSVYYTNVQASFLVSKTLQEGTSEDEFVFTLLNNQHNVWAGAQYYLYTAEGKLVNAQLQQTDSSGRFTLKADQAAMFVGIPQGTVYHVKEEAQPGYVQTVPRTADGYTNMSVEDSVEELTFVNEKTDTAGILTVSKKVVSTTGEEPLASDEFAFTLLKKDGETYTEVQNAVYAVQEGNSESTYKTDADGTFKLKANQTARFRDLESGEYQVCETDLPDEYNIEETEQTQTGVLGEDGLALEFTNQYTPQFLTNLYIHKTDGDGNALSGAKFGLFATSELTDPIYETESDSRGNIVFSDLRLGTYYLAETQPPEGFVPAEDPLKIELIRENREKGFELVVDGTSYGEDPDQDIWFEVTGTDNQDVHIRLENKEAVTVSYAFGNGEHPSVDLPESSTVEKGTTGFEPEDMADTDAYTFEGWYYEPACISEFDSTEAINDDLILYGKWTPKTVQVIYHWSDASQVPQDAELPETQSVRKEQPYVAEQVTTKECWLFQGWYTDSECTTEYIDGTILHEDLNLYGKWQKVDAVIHSADLTAYTGGDSISEDNFPTARYILSMEDGVDVRKFTFCTADGKEFTVDETGKEMLLPELTENYVYAENGEDYTDDSVAGIYSIELSNAPVTAVTDDGEKLQVAYDPGQLVVRLVSQPDTALENLDEIATDVVYGQPSKAVSRPTAYLDPDSEIATNGKDSLGLLGTLDEGANIALLHDNILTDGKDEDSYKQMLTDRAMELLPASASVSDYNFDYVYLDLINTNDGNVWVSSSKGSTVYLPYPEGTDQNTDFMLIHYKGLHREYGIGIVPDAAISVANAELENVKIENTEFGIKFFVEESGFSPFGLVWNNKGEEMEKPNDPVNNNQNVYTPTVNQSVKTGDQTNVMIWLAGDVVVLALAGIVYKVRKSGKKQSSL